MIFTCLLYFLYHVSTCVTYVYTVVLHQQAFIVAFTIQTSFPLFRDYSCCTQIRGHCVLFYSVLQLDATEIS